MAAIAAMGLSGCSQPKSDYQQPTEQAEEPTDEVAFASPLALAGKYEGYGRDTYGSCIIAISVNSEDEALSKFEASLGIRIDRHYPFANGVIVEFKNGFRTAIWQKQIDCKDPPYDPFPKEESTEDAEDLLTEPVQATPVPDPNEEVGDAAEPPSSEEPGSDQ